MATPPAPKPKASPTKKILVITGAAVVALVGLITVASLLGGGEDGVEVETARAQTRAITQSVTASGRVQPEVDVAISSDVSGEIVFLGVQEGDRVQQGQLLVRVQPEVYAEQQAQARAGVLTSQAEVERARAERIRAEGDLARARQLFDRDAIARAEVDAAESRVAQARAGEQAAQYRVQSAQASSRQAGQQLARTAIYAPMDGIVSQLNIEEGERVVGTIQMAGTEIMRIARLDQMLLEADINENDVISVGVGDSAQVEVDAYPGQILRGVVTQIANSARMAGVGTQDQATNFPVEVRITSLHNPEAGRSASRDSAEAGGMQAASADEEPPPAPEPEGPVVQLRPGMSGTVEVFTRTVPNAVVVPISAVTVRDFNRVRHEEAREAALAAGEELPELDPYAEEDLRRVVFVVRDGIAEMVEVETGITDATHIEIRSGLSGDEEVVVGPFRTLRTDLDDGDPVTTRSPRAAQDED